jgi:hypothetical protein
MITDEDQDAYENGVVKILLGIRATANKALTFLPSGAPPFSQLPNLIFKEKIKQGRLKASVVQKLL